MNPSTQPSWTVPAPLCSGCDGPNARIRLEKLGWMARGIAHDALNVMQVMGGNLDRIQEAGKGNPTVLGAVEALEEALARATGMMRLALRTAAGREVVMEACDINRLVENLVAFLRLSLPPGIRAEALLAQDLPALQADPLLLDRMLLELTMNAAAAMDGRGGRIRIQTAIHEHVEGPPGAAVVIPASPGQPHLVVDVADEGSGMEPEVFRRAFESGFTTRPAGHGLGLPMVLDTLRNHGAGLHVRTAHGEGTRFSAYFPLSRACPPEPTHAASTQRSPR